ncbi:MAG: PIG-L deacetylase family protein [Candidatus Dojkabacteria bacterium]|nr:PIG-L deacetylase family protein [Candidatus Dojkabacteria bacterium]MDQ7021346.1 PIG-L deacetylase family protein [Candidatus Dojkabacteria bacterium]
MRKDSFEEIFKDINKVLVVIAHPDDCEVICGGTIARLIDSGKEVRLVTTTNGEKGMQDKRDIDKTDFVNSRIKEQTLGAVELGIKESESFNLNIADGELEASVENIGKIVFHIRQFKPDLVITHNPNDAVIKFGGSKWVNHRDHRNTGWITFDAIYPYSRDRGFFEEHFTEHGLEGHSVNKILVADTYEYDDVSYFEISDFIDKKKNAFKKHISAFNPGDEEMFVKENKFGDKYFEPLRLLKVY